MKKILLIFLLFTIGVFAQNKIKVTKSTGTVGTKTDNETDIGDGKVLAFDTSNNWLEYVAAGVASSVNDSNVVFTDNDSGNVSTTKHGYAPKLSGTSNSVALAILSKTLSLQRLISVALFSLVMPSFTGFGMA